MRRIIFVFERCLINKAASPCLGWTAGRGGGRNGSTRLGGGGAGEDGCQKGSEGREAFSKQMNVPPFLITLLHTARTCVCVCVCACAALLAHFFPIKNKKKKKKTFFSTPLGAHAPLIPSSPRGLILLHSRHIELLLCVTLMPLTNYNM